MKTIAAIIFLVFSIGLQAQVNCIDIVKNDIIGVTRTIAQGKRIFTITAQLPEIRDTIWTDTLQTTIDTIHISPVTVQFRYAVDTDYAMDKYLNDQKDGFMGEVQAKQIQMERADQRRIRFRDELIELTAQRDSLIAKRQELINLLQ